MATYIGIDPGKGGGIAWTGSDGPGAVNMPETETDLAAVLRLLGEQTSGAVAVVERVSSSPQMGVVSAFTFGRGYGCIRGCLVTLGIPFVEVAPVKWQKAMGCLSRGDKNVTKRRAQQLFPHLKVTHATADALLLATYCARLDWRGVQQTSPTTGLAATQSALEGE
jgi:crossover junction endodeoxyribonuclease RuvC